MKIMKYLTIGLLFIGMTTLVGCKKEVGPKGEQGIQGEQGPAGPSAKTYDFTLTFGTSTTEATYSMPQGSMYGKATFVYLDKGYKDWIMLPYYENNPGYVPVNYVATIDEILEKIKITTQRGDNQAGSPWASNNVSRNFRAVVIETNGLKTHPDLDFSNFKEVAEAFDLK